MWDQQPNYQSFKTKNYSKPDPVKIMYGGGEKKSEENIIKSKRNLLKLKKEDETIKDRIITYIRRLLKQQEKDYYKPKRLSNFWNNYIEYESNGDKNKKNYHQPNINESEPYVRNTIIDLLNFEKWKIQLIIAINIISLKDAEEERVIY